MERAKDIGSELGGVGTMPAMEIRSRQRWVRWTVIVLAVVVALSMVVTAVASFLPF